MLKIPSNVEPNDILYVLNIGLMHLLNVFATWPTLDEKLGHTVKVCQNWFYPKILINA